MPVHRGKDKLGKYYRWGNIGKKYYYIPNNIEYREIAYTNA